MYSIVKLLFLRRKARVLLWTLVATVTVFACVCTSAYESCDNASHLINCFGRRASERKNGMIFEVDKPRVLLWTPFFGREDYYVGLGDSIYRQQNCSYLCTNIVDKELMLTSDAVIFHLRDSFRPLPVQRVLRQKWIFFTLEMPGHSGYLLWDGNYTFNWTMTYHRRSDVPIPFGVHLPRGNGSDYNDDKSQALWRRPKSVAWIVSNCDAVSQREKLFERLQGLIDTTKYGHCGDLPCPDSIDCYEHAASEHLFYLAWENSFCEDYVTEKAWNALAAGMVPIVYGGAAYEEILPPRSFIDISQFPSIQALTDHLKFLRANQSAYLEYFAWKKLFTVQQYPAYSGGWCNLCEKLHNERTTPTHSEVDIFDFWSIEKQCPHQSKTLHRLLTAEQRRDDGTRRPMPAPTLPGL